MRRFRIALFGLNGIGNAALRAIAASRHELVCVVTREEAGSFPYYAEHQISDEAKSLGIPCYADCEGEEKILLDTPDIILVATYHRKISSEILSRASHAFNIHPSLLPKYRGATPYFWVLKNGEKETGITIHRLTSAMDAGDILLQKSLPIQPQETQGSLRKRLADLARDATLELVNQLEIDMLNDIPQNEQDASFYPRFTAEHRNIELNQNAEEVCQHIRALMPWPRATIASVNCQIDEIIEIRNSRTGIPGTISYLGDNVLCACCVDRDLILHVVETRHHTMN